METIEGQQQQHDDDQHPPYQRYDHCFVVGQERRGFIIVNNQDFVQRSCSTKIPGGKITL